MCSVTSRTGRKGKAERGREVALVASSRRTVIAESQNPHQRRRGGGWLHTRLPGAPRAPRAPRVPAKKAPAAHVIHVLHVSGVSQASLGGDAAHVIQVIHVSGASRASLEGGHPPR